MNKGYLLAARTNFSIGESLLSPEQLVKTAKERGYHTVALCDTMTISGMMDFIKAAKDHEVKPIIGCRVRLVDNLCFDVKQRKSMQECYPKLFVRNEAGMNELMQLLTLANSTERFYFNARLTVEDVQNALRSQNLIITTGDIQGIFHLKDYQSVIDSFNNVLTDSKLFLEQLQLDSLLCNTINKKIQQTALQFDLKTIITRPVLYKDKADADSRDVLATISSNQKMEDPWRHIPYHRDLALNKAKEIDGDHSEMLCDMCSYTWEKKEVSLPKMADDESRELMVEVSKGWKTRILKEVMGYKPPEELIPEYKARLVYELGVLKKMKFERYFLMVKDIVSWSKNNGIMVGPGRGSGAGSLVSFLLGITDLDPIRFDLIFERFINPERADLPDADIDFMSTRRSDVIDYILAKHGEDRVAGISNYTTMASSGAIRDCSRVHGLTSEDMTASKLVPKEHGKSYSLTESIEVVPEIKEFAIKYPDIWQHAQNVEGCLRSLGQHAAGIIIAGEDIKTSGRAVLERRSGKAMVVNWDKTSVEDWGLVKMDILGLQTLDVLRLTIESVLERTGEAIDLLKISIDDKETMVNFGKGNTDGIFQFLSSGMRHILKQLAEAGTLTFDDLCATTALYRPGPMESGMIEDYVSWRTGETKATYDHPNMIAALQKTGGSMIFQEQIMKLSRDLAGYSMAEADKLRSIMGKKKVDLMAEQKEKFVNGCIEHSKTSRELGEKIFDKIDKFAGYGFNASHSAAYSLISYWSMYLKTHYPADFFASVLTVEDTDDKIKSAVMSAKKAGVSILPPDVSYSGDKFVIVQQEDGTEVLYAALSKVKGISEKTAGAIVEARNKVGKFESVDHFIQSVNKRSVNKRVVEALHKVGAFCSIDKDAPGWDDESRLKDQLELLPGMIVKYVKPTRKTVIDEVSPLIEDRCAMIKSCSDCDLSSSIGCVTPSSVGKSVKLMIVTDSPTNEEAKHGVSFSGGARRTLLDAMATAGFSAKNGANAYHTSVVKNAKREKLTTEQITECRKHLNAEVEIIKPSVILCLGGAAIRHFYPEAKGGWSEMCGQVIYDKNLDATLVFGLNPQMIFFKPEVEKLLVDVFKIVRDILS